MIKKLILATLVALTTLPAFADRNGEFRDYRDYNLSADDFVAQYEGWGFTTAYEDAKVKLWGDECGNGHEVGCSDRLAANWEMQHAAAYIVADAVQNRGYDLDDSVRYAQILTQQFLEIPYNGSVYQSDGRAWDIESVDGLIEEYLNPTDRDFKVYILGMIDGTTSSISSEFWLNW